MARQYDFFGNEIEIGDAYFYGAPPTAGIVIEIKNSYVTLKYTRTIRQWNDDIGDFQDGLVEERTMMCSSPKKGVCLDKKGFV